MPDRQRVLGRIRLRHLQCFQAVAPLLLRGRRGATLTPEAEAFLVHANASLSALTQAVDSVAAAPHEAVLRIGVLPTVAPFAAQALQALRATRPLTTVRVSSGRNQELIDQLRGHELEAVLARLADPDAMAGLSYEHLYAEPMWIVMRPGHALAGQCEPSAAQLSAQPLVLPLGGTLIRQLADSHLAASGISPRNGVVETLDTALARALVQSGDHLWFTPASAALAEVEAGTLARLPMSITPEEPVGLIIRTDSLHSPALDTWLAAVRQAAAERRRFNRTLASAGGPRRGARA
jgi:LysR family pca operon transcriptional activator